MLGRMQIVSDIICQRMNTTERFMQREKQKESAPDVVNVHLFLERDCVVFAETGIIDTRPRREIQMAYLDQKELHTDCVTSVVLNLIEKGGAARNVLKRT